MDTRRKRELEKREAGKGRKFARGAGWERTDCRFNGPMRQYRSPYSAVVTGAFDLMTE